MWFEGEYSLFEFCVIEYVEKLESIAEWINAIKEIAWTSKLRYKIYLDVFRNWVDFVESISWSYYTFCCVTTVQ